MLWWFAQTTLIAGALAVAATLAGRWKRLGPEARHALWLLVLIKLAIPPFVAWPWSVPDAWPSRVEPAPVSAPVALTLPASPVVPDAISPPVASLPAPSDPPLVAGPPPSPEEVLAGVEASEELPVPAAHDPRPIEAPLEVRQPVPAPRIGKSEISNWKSSIWDWNTALLAAWLAGSVVVVARRGFKVVRFHRSLKDARSAPGWLVDEARAIGDRVGVRPPPVVATSRVATPLLWCLGRPRLILPEALIKRLGADRWPGILAHELAHLARGDHWVVRLELLVEAAWWWNPLFWLARRKIHEQAEIACDARVVRSLPERRYAYAEALVDVCEHIARAAIPSPALGVGGAGAAHSLEGRLNMILRDPIPHRPTRRAALLAALLAALALPAWTLGQQPEAPPAKPDAPPSKPEAPAPASERAKEPTDGFFDVPQSKPAATPAPDVPTPVELGPNEEPESLPTILAAQAKAREGLGTLSFRYVVASRNQSHTSRVANRGGGMGDGPAGGGPGARGGMANPAGGGFGAPGGMGGGAARGGFGGPGVGGSPAQLAFQRSRTIHVQVADVILGSAGNYRLDVLQARPASEAALAQAPARPLTWDRRFVAYDGGGYTTLEMAWDKTGPVPFRWTGSGGMAQQSAWGDSLTQALLGGPNGRAGLGRAIDPRRGIDPLDPRPANVLDLNGGAILDLNGGAIPFLDARFAQAEVGGIDKIDGRNAVRVAWFGHDNTDPNGDNGLRGLCWLAPDLGYAVVRSDATQDPGQGTNLGRRSWRKRSSDFVKVANLWLPRKVSYEESQADPYPDGEPLRRREQEMTFEYRLAGATLPAETFHPKLAIQSLDDLSGNFTANPPELPAGLVDRLAKAVAESKFGPPLVERTVEEPKADAPPADASRKPNQPDPGPGAAQPSVKPGDLPRVDARSAPLDDPAKADPRMIARTAPGFDDPVPTVDPKVDDAISARAPADRAELDRMIELRFKLDPEVIDLAGQMSQARKKLDDAKRIVLQPTTDPSVKAAQRKLDQLKEKYTQSWEVKSRTFREELGSGMTRGRDEIEVLQARRDGKAAEVRKAEAQRDMAVMERNTTIRLRNSNQVGAGEVALFEGKLAVTEAELASKKAGLDEADALLNQAKRRLGVATAANPTPDPNARSPLAANPKDADRDVESLDARDEVAFRQARRDGKAAEVRKAEARLEQAKLDMNRASLLLTRNAIDQKSFDQTKTDLKLAEAEVESKKADLAEADVFLNQAKRRLSGRSTASQGSSSPGDRPSTLAELRDAVELAEAQLQGKQAELRGVEAKFDSSKSLLDVRKPMFAEGRITQIVWVETETNWKLAQAELEAKKAEVLEAEVRIKQAKRRLEATEARLKREAERARARLDWSEDMHKKGFVSKANYDADKASYDELMIQLDPKYVPTAPAVAAPDGPRP